MSEFDAKTGIDGFKALHKSSTASAIAVFKERAFGDNSVSFQLNDTFFSWSNKASYVLKLINYLQKKKSS